ncbi:MAG: BamA/TamA family outer membrane protein [Candidatus Zixiibacteriota bacterium]
MTKRIKILILIMIIAASSLFAENFGRNKVQYTKPEWLFLKSTNYIVYYPKGYRRIADYSVKILEEAYIEYSRILSHDLEDRAAIIVYPNKAGFQATNVSLQIIPESTGGFTEFLHHRAVLPFDGSYEEFRHVLRHELVHVFQLDMLYQNDMSGFLTPNRYFEFPLWIAEGQAEYLSSFWNEEADAYLANLIFTESTVPPDYLGGYQVYKQGQAMMRYIAEVYGIKKLGELLRNLRAFPSSNRALEETIGLDIEKFYEDWKIYEKRHYFEGLAHRQIPDDIARNLTEHEENRSYINLQPALSPDGNMMAFVSDRRDYTELYLMDLISGDIRKIDSGERGGALESFHPLRSHSNWSYDGEFLIYTGKKGGKDAIHIYNVCEDKKEIIYTFEDIEQITTAAFSPDSRLIVFSGLQAGRQDLYIFDRKDSSLQKLTDDNYEDRDPKFLDDGQQIIFSSDRPVIEPYGRDSEDTFPGLDDDFTGTDSIHHNLFIIDIEDNIIPITKDERDADHPTPINDNEIIYTSVSNGRKNVYKLDMIAGKKKPITDLISGVMTISVAKDADKIVFSTMNKGAYDIYEIDDLEPFSDTLNFTRHYKNSDSLNTPFSLYQSEFKDSNNADYLFNDAEEINIKEEEYKPKFTADAANVNVGYNTYYGMQGISYITLSDLLGNHRMVVMADLVYDLDNSNFYFGYGYLAHRFNYYLSIFYMNSFYRTYDWVDFKDNQTGGELGIEYPFSQFERVELLSKFFQLDRHYYTPDSIHQDETSWNLDVKLSLVQDNALWRHTGPIAGTRKKLTLQYVPPLSEESPDFVALEGDFRFYQHVGDGYGFAERISAGIARGPNPKQYMVGGVENWFYPAIAEKDIYSTEDMYFSKMVVPLRGYQYFEFQGETYFAANLEFRYPFVQYMKLGFPPITIAGLNGGVFVDMALVTGSDLSKVNLFANDDENSDLKSGVGFGIRSGLAFFLINYELAWKTDFYSIGDKPVHYFSIGAEF